MLNIVRDIKRVLINIYQYLGIDKLLVILSVGSFPKEMNDEIQKYLVRSNLIDSKNCKKLRKDIKSCYLKYLTSPQEYFLYEYDKDQSMEYREECLSDKKRIRILKKKVGLSYFDCLCDKYQFYLSTQKYFRRSVITVSSKADWDSFYKLSQNTDSIFVKPVSASFGIGCAVYDVSTEDKIRDVFEKISSSTNTKLIVEDYIKQDSEMALWNASSCNTIRMPAFLNEKGEFHILQPCLRTGRQGKVVDNAGGGGLISLIDEYTGIIKSDAVDKSGKRYAYHPDSHRKFKGTQIPMWNELVSLAEEIFRNCLPDYKYIGFDFALTDKGWVLIEGNWGQFIGQYYSHEGVADKFIEYIH